MAEHASLLVPKTSEFPLIKKFELSAFERIFSRKAVSKKLLSYIVLKFFLFGGVRSKILSTNVKSIVF